MCIDFINILLLFSMREYIILFVVIIVVIILFMNSDLLKINDIDLGNTNDSDKNLLKIRKILKKNKNRSDYLSSDDSESIYKNKKLTDDSSDDPFAYDNSDISFDDSESISEQKDVKNIKYKSNLDNKKLLNDFQKFIEIKNRNIQKKKNNLKQNTNKNLNIQEMHKLAAQLRKNEPQKIQQMKQMQQMKQIPKISEIANSDININNDLTDTINGIIHNELNNKN